MSHIALCCLEDSTLSNLVHRRRRCARIVLNQILLPGGQYARGQGRSFHQTKETIVAPEEPFLSSRTGLRDFSSSFALSDANVCNRSRKRLKPPPQTFASVIVNVCGEKICPRKYVQPSPQVRASVLASTCIRPCKYVRLR